MPHIGARIVRHMVLQSRAGICLCLRAAATPTLRAKTSEQNIRRQVECSALRYYTSSGRCWRRC